MVEEILHYWFGSNRDCGAVAAEKSRLWWSKDPAVDAEIRRRFQDLVEAAGGGGLVDWVSTPWGRLALVLLTDQFPRSIYRDTPKAFAFDPVARLHCLEGIEIGADQRLRPIERVFFYLPLEHSESLEHQAQSVRLFTELAETSNPDHRPVFESYLDYALRHRDIIERFGRFPHRNAILGRQSTGEEIAFLQAPGSAF